MAEERIWECVSSQIMWEEEQPPSKNTVVYKIDISKPDIYIRRLGSWETIIKEVNAEDHMEVKEVIYNSQDSNIKIFYKYPGNHDTGNGKTFTITPFVAIWDLVKKEAYEIREDNSLMEIKRCKEIN